MPIFEYQCQDCGKISEFLVGVVQAKVTIACRACGSTKMTKKISSGFVSTGAKSKQDYCAQKGPCSTPACMHGGGCCH
ncbi:MAG: zinc ribbon domain-containing protein [Candidatus Omnitrophica bacterium]|jgi:putative FmdB family regulatory protein|nr:zinc ribbon domain-containing protein [Candidatus Omnitrophota bacterium]